MRHRIPLVAALCVVLCSSGPAWAARSELIPETTAARHGLARPWFTQVELDASRGQLRTLVLEGGVLYAQADGAILHAIDAETGRTLWRRTVGRPELLTLPPGVGSEMLAVLNGSRLFVLDRMTGELRYEKPVGGAPSAAPCPSAMRVYVPLSSGRVEAYRWAPPPERKSDAAPKQAIPSAQEILGKRDDARPIPPPLFAQSGGIVLVQPRLLRENSIEEYVAWSTDRGQLNIGRIDRRSEDYLTLKYRLETGEPVVGRPVYLPPDPQVDKDSGLLIAVSRDGFVHAIRQRDGVRAWRFGVGEPVIEPPALIDNRVFICAQLGGMTCLTAKTGKKLWLAPEAVQFVAAGKSRVYGADRSGQLLIFNAENGELADSLALPGSPIKLRNNDTDRIYLADEAGLIQCLHEQGLREPIGYAIERRRAEEADAKKVDAENASAQEKGKSNKK